MPAPRRSPALLLVLTLLLAISQVLPIAAQQATPSPDVISSVDDDPGNTGRQPGPALSGHLNVRWTIASDFAAGTDPTPAVGSTSIFINSALTNMVGAYDALTGESLWSFDTGRSFSAPIASEGAVYVSSVNGLWSLDARTGEPIWLMEGATPLGADNGVFYGVSVGTVFAADAATGELIWQRPPVPDADLAIDGNRLYLGTSTGVVILDRADGREIARLDGEDLDLLHFPAVDHTGLFVTTYTSVTAFELDGFEQRWTTELPLPVSRVAIGDEAIFVSSGSGLHALDHETGQELWRVDGTGAGRPLIADEMVYVVIDSQLMAVSAGDGAIVWTFSSRVAPLVAIANGLIYLGPEEASGRTLAVGGSVPVQTASANANEAQSETSLRIWTKPENGPCDVEPRSAEQIGSLQPPSAGTGPSSELSVPALVEEIPGSAAAGQEIADAITDIARMEIACLNEGAELRRVALWTDEYLYRTLLESDTPVDQVIDSMSAASAPPLVRQRKLIEVRDARTLQDGTVAAIVVFESRFITLQSPHPGPTRADVIVFRETAVGWRVDGRIIDVDAALISSALTGSSAASLASPPSESMELSGVPMYRVNAERTGVNPGPLPEQLPVELWRADVGDYRGFASSPIVVGDTLFVGGEFSFFALSRDSGDVLWSRQLDEFFNFYGSEGIAITQGLLMRDVGGVRLLDVQTGQVLWENLSLGSPISLAASEGLAIVGTDSGAIHAVDALSGVSVWSRDLPLGQPFGAMAVSDGVIYVTTIELVGSTYDGSLYALDLSNGDVLWERAHLNAFSAPVVAGDKLFIVEFGGTLFAVDATSGETVWRAALPGRSSSAPAVANGLVYTATGSGWVLAYDAGTGEHVWSTQRGSSFWLAAPSIAGDSLVLGNEDGNLYAFDTEDGHERWRFAADGWIRSTATIDDGRIYFQTDGGSLYALGSEGDSGTGQAVVAASPAVDTSELATNEIDISVGYGVSVALGDSWRVRSAGDASVTVVGGATTVELEIDDDDGVAGALCVAGRQAEVTLFGYAASMQPFDWPGDQPVSGVDGSRAWGSWEASQFHDPDPLVVRVECRRLSTTPNSILTIVSTTPSIAMDRDAPEIDALIEGVQVDPGMAAIASPAAESASPSPGSGYAVAIIGPVEAVSVDEPAMNEHGQVAGTVSVEQGLDIHAVILDGGEEHFLDEGSGQGSRAFFINDSGDVAGSVIGPNGLPGAAIWNDSGLYELASEEYASSITGSMHSTGEAVVLGATLSGQLSGSLWRDGRLAEVDDLGFGSFLADVNDDGVAVGLMWDGTGSVAITWDGEERVVLETLGGEENFAYDITDSGVIAGISDNEDGNQHAVIWSDGAVTDLGTLGGETSDVDFANEAGQVLGSSETREGATHFFLWQNGTMTDLGLFQGSPITGFDLNDAGQVVGWAPGSDGRYHAILWHDGVVTDLGTGGGVQAWGYAINNQGQVAGIVELEDGRRQFVRWDPSSPPELLPSPTPTVTPTPTQQPTAIPTLAGGGIQVILRDIYFEPAELIIPPDTAVTLHLVNEGSAPHSFAVDALDINVQLGSGESADVVINAPAGTYEFYCDVPGHRETGMIGTLVVT